MMQRPFVLAALALLPVPLTAQNYRPEPAQGGFYRQGEPPVLTPAPEARIDRSVGFRSRYAALKSPTMVLLWNRVFSDEVQSEYVDRTRVDVEAERAGVAVAAPGFAAGYSAGRGSAEITSGRTRVREQQPAANLDAEDDAGVESAFIDALQQNGVRLVDRSVAMRTARAAARAKGDTNVQALETSALVGRTGYLIEVTQIPASDSPIGTKFRVSVKNLRTAALLASFVSNGAGIKPRPRLVAGPNGFQRQEAADPGPSDIGGELAVQLMERLARTLR